MSIAENKYSLAIHTSSPELGLAINNFAGSDRYQIWNLGRDLSSLMHQKLAEFIQPQTWQDLEFIAVAKGPGSFTGTRIGIVTARTFAQQLNIPVFAISTLAAVAWAQRSQIETGKAIALQMPAMRGQFFVAIYQINYSENPPNTRLIQIFPETAIDPENWQHILNNLPNAYHLIQVENHLGASVTSLLELAYLDWQLLQRPHWSEALPFYGQHPIE